MDNKEVMEYENEAMENEADIVETEPAETGISTGKALLIGVGVAAAITAAVKLGKKLWAKHKAKKELRLVDDGDVIEPTDEEIMELAE